MKMTEASTPERFSKRDAFNFAQVEGALCAWEWMLGNQGHPKLDEWHDRLGSPGMRMLAMQAGDICDRAFKHMESSGYEFVGAYDFEFVPDVCARLDWDALAKDNQYSDGLYEPDIPALVTTMITADKAQQTDPRRRSFQKRDATHG